jgi:hypothetical protein
MNAARRQQVVVAQQNKGMRGRIRMFAMKGRFISRSEH